MADTIDSNSLSIKGNDDNSSIISQELSDSSDENSEVSYTDEDESENLKQANQMRVVVTIPRKKVKKK